MRNLSDNVRELGGAMTRARRVLNILIDADVLGRRTGVQPSSPRSPSAAPR